MYSMKATKQNSVLMFLSWDLAQIDNKLKGRDCSLTTQEREKCKKNQPKSLKSNKLNNFSYRFQVLIAI